MAKGSNSKVKSPTFEHVAEDWFSSRTNLKESTKSRYRAILDKVLFPKIGKKKMKKICDDGFCAKLKEESLSEGYSESTVANYVTVIKSVIRYYNGMDEVDSVSVPRTALDEKKYAVYHAQQVIKVAKDDENHDNYVKLGVLIIMYTGISISELCGLTWADFDLMDGNITIRRTYAREYDSEQKKSTLVLSKVIKTRWIPISSRLKIVLESYREKGVKGYVLTNSGNPMEPRVLQNNLVSMFKKAGMKSYSAGELRDMFVSNAIRCGMSIPALSEITGISISHLYDRYSSFICVTEGLKRLEIKKVVY